jgi:hypothetical protein
MCSLLFHKSPLFVPILIRVNIVDVLIPKLFYVHFNISLPVHVLVCVPSDIFLPDFFEKKKKTLFVPELICKIVMGYR